MENLPRIKQRNAERHNCVRKAKKHGKMRKSRAERSGKTVSANISVSMVRHVVTPRKPNNEAEKENPPDTNAQAGSRRFAAPRSGETRTRGFDIPKPIDLLFTATGKQIGAFPLGMPSFQGIT